MSKVKKLSEKIISKIAAGEVIVGPDSVIKELIENSLDAKSNFIEVEIKNGGVDYIRVSDNGEGIEKDDLKLCLLRHTTSKLQSEEDLYAIKQNGFRGEALYSIASVSMIKIISSTDGVNGYSIFSNNFNISDISLEPHKKGTTVIVSSLFFNIPARKKFLRKPVYYNKVIYKLFLKYALAYPYVSFKLINNNKTIYNFQKTELKDRIKDIFIYESSKLINFENEKSKFKIIGFISNRDIIKNNSENIYIFVNRRPVYNRAILSGILRPYNELLQMKKYPLAIVFLYVPYDFVDVNVHPQKSEVAFKDQRLIFSFVYENLKGALENSLNISGIIQKEISVHTISSPKLSEHNKSYDIKISTLSFENKQKNIITDIEEPMDTDKPYRIIGQLFKTYILVEFNNNLLVIDQHTAAEKLIYFELKNKHIKHSVENFLIPIVIELGEHKKYILEKKKLLYQIGIDIEDAGGYLINIKSMPRIFNKTLEDKQQIKEFLIESFEDKTLKETELKEKILKTFSCRKAVKANTELKREEMEYLIENLIENNILNTCPHGRPIVVKFEKKYINNQFQR